MHKLPDIQNCHSFHEFFKKFLSLNEGAVSYRTLAIELNWPPSLLSDLVHGHRGLAIGRAVEFGRHFQMTSPEIERLIMLSLADSPNPSMQEFVGEYFKTEGRQFADPYRESPDVLVDQDLSALHMFLVWTGGQTTSEEIGELMVLSPALKKREVLEEKLQMLRDLGVIEGRLPHVKILKASYGCTDMNRAQFFRSVEALRPLVTNPDIQGHWRLSRVHLSRKIYPEFCQRMNALVNWVQNQALNDEPGTGKPRTDYVILQLNFMVTHLLNLPALGLKVMKRANFKHTVEIPEELTPGQNARTRHPSSTLDI